MRKLIILIISIIIPIIGAFSVGFYDYNVWYNPEGKNASEFQSEYKSYVLNKVIDYSELENEQKTEERIKVYRILENYYYSEKPIFEKDVEENGERLFTIKIYRNLFWKAVSSTQKEEKHYRYEVFLFNINYEALKEKFLKLQVPNDEIVNKADYPYFVVNFYPNQAYNSSEAMISSSGGVAYEHSLYDGSKITGYRLGDSSSINIYDYASNPQKRNDSDVFVARTFVFYDYSSFVDEKNIANFDNCYIKLDCVLASDENYTLKESLLQEEVKGLTFNTENINFNDYLKGATSTSSMRETLNNINLDGVKSYDSWIVSKYIWWQCLIAFGVFGIIMAGFYFTFTYDPNTNKNKKKK